MKQPTDINGLTPLPDFPGYYIDTTNGNVYSYFDRYFSSGTPVLKQIRGRMKGRAKQLCFQLYIDGKHKQFSAMHGRLMFSATHGISYFDIPKSARLSYTQNGGISVYDPSELAKKAWSDKLAKQNESRIANIDQRIQELNLMRQAYMGDRKPLFGYVYEQQKRIVNIIKMKTGWSYRTATESFGAAIDILFDVISGKRLDNIFMLDCWLISTAIGTMRSTLSRKSKQMPIYERKI